MLLFPPGVERLNVRLNGQSARPLGYEGDVPADGWYRVVYEGLGARTIQLDLETGSTSPIPVYVVDRSYGVPKELPCKASLLRRGYEPMKEGDQLLVSAQLEL
jgi:hypothetical protein